MKTFTEQVSFSSAQSAFPYTAFDKATSAPNTTSFPASTFLLRCSLSVLVQVMSSPLSGFRDSCVSTKCGCQTYDKLPNWRAEVFLFVRDLALRHWWAFQQPVCRQHRPYSPGLSQIKFARLRNPKHSQVSDFLSLIRILKNIFSKNGHENVGCNLRSSWYLFPNLELFCRLLCDARTLVKFTAADLILLFQNFGYVTPCGLVNIDRRCLRVQCPAVQDVSTVVNIISCV